MCLDGQIVENSNLWFNKRRKEIVNLFEQNQFGVTPKEKIEINYDLFESEGSAFDNTAERTQVTLNLFGNQTEKKINLVYYIPKNVIKLTGY